MFDITKTDENLVPKTAQTGWNLRFSTEPHQLFLGSKEEDGEIGVFQAEKYFNGTMDHHEDMTPKPKASEQKAGAPSVISESSANSQSALLRKISRNNPKPERARGGCRGFVLPAAGCRTCSCSSSSGSVDEPVHSLNPKPERTRGTGRCRGFLLAAVGCRICSCSSSSGSVDEEAVHPRPLSDPALEVIIRSPKADSVLFSKRLAMLSSDLTARKGDFDTESDGSSDLFEIESLTGKARCPAVAAAVCYPPSEASIQWSVITASAADFSVVSKNDDRDHGQRRRSGGGGALLLGGCKSQKAVRVAGDAHRSVADQERIDGRMRRGSATTLAVRNPVARFQAETRLAGFDPKYGKHGSHLLYVGN